MISQAENAAFCWQSFGPSEALVSLLIKTMEGLVLAQRGRVLAK